MLRSLSIRNIVLIEALDLEFGAGLTVLTGETGAGKSILLDALGFSLGHKVRRDLVRAGADSASVVAEFAVPDGHPAYEVCEGLDLPIDDDTLILRRVANADGPARAFVNDRRISADALGQIGATLVEVHGQHDDRGLLDPRAHGPLLDAFGGLGPRVGRTRKAWNALREADAKLTAARTQLAEAEADADFLRHSVDELERFAPLPGEDEALDAERRLIKQSEKLTSELAKAADHLAGQGAEGALAEALSRLNHVAENAEGRLDPTISAIDRTMSELGEAQSSLGEVLDALNFDPGRLDDVEERLFALRGLARKHNVQPDALPDLTADMSKRLSAITTGAEQIGALEAALSEAEKSYETAATDLSVARRTAAKKLDKAVTSELAPLKMEAAAFKTDISGDGAGPEGVDKVRFAASINPGAPTGPIDKIASGGELSRFLLALKVCLSEQTGGQSMIFDEIDRGVGGATADAVGRRLARLADSGQVLVVTHSPQVAARGTQHLQIAKSSRAGTTRTDVSLLDETARNDEIARMLAGEQITEEARSAARALIEGSTDD